MPENRPLRDDDVIHMSLASPTGAASPFDTQITLAEVATYVRAKIAAPVAPAAEPAAEPAESATPAT